MKKLIVLVCFSLCMLVIGSAFAEIEKRKVKDDRSEIVPAGDQLTIDGGHSSFVVGGVVADFFQEERPITSSVPIEAKSESYQDVTLHINPAANSPPNAQKNPTLHWDPGLR